MFGHYEKRPFRPIHKFGVSKKRSFIFGFQKSFDKNFKRVPFTSKWSWNSRFLKKKQKTRKFT